MRKLAIVGGPVLGMYGEDAQDPRVVFDMDMVDL